MVLAELKNVYKVYRKGKIEIPVLKGINFKINKGEYISITGPSGAGKSTLLHILGLIDKPSQGDVFFFGKNAGEMYDHELSRLRGFNIGFVFQAFNLIPDLKAWQNVALPLHYQGVPKRKQKERALEVLERVGLVDRANHYPAELSGGEEQRVAIARALIINPLLVLADEPTGNLDSLNSEIILQLLEDLVTQQSTLIIVTHDPNIASRARKTVRLIDGQLKDA
ncbi:MAG: ABC transporter ATP-binding protein [Gammaproteobacteria bacterium]|nr:ABC transporter ATP-binding protein [Gammaproteobacteria bacterium]